METFRKRRQRRSRSRQSRIIVKDKCSNFNIQKFPIKDEDVCNDNIQSNNYYRKERNQYFKHVFDNQYRNLLKKKRYDDISCLMEELIKNIEHTKYLSRKYENNGKTLLKTINQNVMLREDNNEKIADLVDMALVRDINMKKEKSKVKSINKSLLKYSSVTAFVILLQIYLIFFV